MTQPLEGAASRPLWVSLGKTLEDKIEKKSGGTRERRQQLSKLFFNRDSVVLRPPRERLLEKLKINMIRKMMASRNSDNK